jgi:soluble lytic murein transglycosylase
MVGRDEITRESSSMNGKRSLRIALWACGPLLLCCAVTQSSTAPRPDHRPGAAVVADSPRPCPRAQIEREAILDLVHEYRFITDHASIDRLSDAIHQEAVAAGVDPLLVAAIVARESSFRSRVESHAGAVGLMQLRPFVAKDLAERHQVEWRGLETLHAPELNLRLGARYYRELTVRFGGDPRLALAAYHRGPTRLARQLERGPLGDSRYVDRVLELYERLDERRREGLSVRS